jgi:hypothetical protein
MTNRKTFFDVVREELGSGSLQQSQVDGLLLLLTHAEIVGMEKNQLAYVLATVWHETAKTVQPVKEAFTKSEDWRKEHLRYYPYYGRGYVQLTWDYNYKKFGNRLGIDLYKNPDIALHEDVACKILFDGMIHGMFTGVDLSTYINITKSDFINARRIINGTDKAKTIADYAQTFMEAL